MVVPYGTGGATRYGVGRRATPDTWAKTARARVFAQAVGRVPLPPLRRLITIAQRSPRQPFFVSAAAREHGLPEDVGWFLIPGAGDTLARGVFVIFPPGESRPEWVLKFARVPGYRSPFDRDARGLGLAQEAGPVVSHRAPRLLGGFEVAGLHASLETAACGKRFDGVLEGPGGAERKLAEIERIVDWIIEVGAATASPPAGAAPARERVRDLVRDHGSDVGVTVELVDAIPSGPSVFEHSDLGSWNVIAERGSFTVVDWESARPTGFPLADLLYFVISALPLLDRVPEPDRPGYLSRLFRGEGARSELVFGWVRRALAAIGAPLEAAGGFATLCWLHHALSYRERVATLRRYASGDPGLALLSGRMPQVWLEDPLLGVEWQALRVSERAGAPG
jgi:hypothetical protein